jgi:hypothetical protein
MPEETVTRKSMFVYRDEVSQYIGRCPKCDAQHLAWLVDRSKFIPPPAITAVCQCQIPVTEVQMFYQGPIST